MIRGLPEELLVDFQKSIYMEYTMDQTYNDYTAPTTYKNAQTMIYNNVTFDSEYNWNTRTAYQIKAWASTCAGLDYGAIFDYTFSNLTRQIDDVSQSHLNWNIMNKHVSFYSGKSPDTKEMFFLDEILIIMGKEGIREEFFDKIDTNNITINGNIYDTNMFQLNTSFTLLHQG